MCVVKNVWTASEDLIGFYFEAEEGPRTLFLYALDTWLVIRVRNGELLADAIRRFTWNDPSLTPQLIATHRPVSEGVERLLALADTPLHISEVPPWVQSQAQPLASGLPTAEPSST